MTTVPTVHTNGTSREALMEQRSDAIRALHAAERALREMAPHGRDFPSGGLSEAMGQHERRVDSLRRLRASIEAERQAIFATRKGA